MADDKKPLPPQKPIAERKEKPKKDDKKVEKATQKEAITTNKNLDVLVSANVSSAGRAERKADALSKSVDAQKEIDKLNAAGRTKDAEKFQKALDESVKLLKGSKNDKSIENRLAELTAINDQSNKITESLQKTIANDPSVTGIERLTKKIEDQTAKITSDTSAIDTGKRLDKLGGMFGQFSTTQTQELQQAFNQGQEDLKNAIEAGDSEGEALARAQLEAVSKGAESEENRREAQKLNEEANSRLAQIATGMESFGGKLDGAISAGAKGAGFLAGLTGLALFFIDPEKFQEIISGAIEKLSVVLEYVKALFEGDSEKASALFQENIGLFGSIIGSIVLLFSGKLIKFLGTALKVARGFRIFMMGTMLPTLGAMFTGMMTAMAPIVAAMAPILLPILAIAAVFGIIVLALTKIRDALGFTSVFDVLMLGLAHMKDAFGHIVNTIGSIVNFILGIVEKFGRFLGFEIDLPEIPKMSTDNAANKKAELEVKAKEAELEKIRQEANAEAELDIEKHIAAQEDLKASNQSPPTIDGEGLLAMSDSNAAGQKQSVASTNTIIQQNTGGSVSKVSKVTSNVIQSPITKATSTLASVTSR